MNDISGARPRKFPQGQQVYTWNGIQHCTKCGQITEQGTCPQHCWDQFLPSVEEQIRDLEALGFDRNGEATCADCRGTISLAAGAEFTRFEFDDGRSEITCGSCSAIRLDEAINTGKLVQDEDGAWFDPALFPDRKRVWQIGDPVGPDEEHPSYLAIEAAIAAGEAFQCAYCGITDDIDQLDDSRPGLLRCLTCRDKHEAATPTTDEDLYWQAEADLDAWLTAQEQVDEAWHIYRIWTSDPGGPVAVDEITNDNLDQGWASEQASWSNTFDTLEAALKHTGKSRQGISCRVEVYLNGQKI